MRTESNESLVRTDLYLRGAATFLRLPQLTDELERLPAGHEIHVHFRDLDYVDDAALEAISTWEKQRSGRGQKVVLEWNEALRLYRDRNPLGRYQRAGIEISAAAH
jgi:MFS superfamily sulfate permease-like transporter